MKDITGLDGMFRNLEYINEIQRRNSIGFNISELAVLNFQNNTTPNFGYDKSFLNAFDIIKSISYNSVANNKNPLLNSITNISTSIDKLMLGKEKFYFDNSILNNSIEIFKNKLIDTKFFDNLQETNKVIEALTKSINYNLLENIESEDEIILSLESANEYVEILNADEVYNENQIITFINRIFIALLDKKNLPSPTNIIFTIIIGILVNRLDSLLFVDEKLPIENKTINNYSTKNYFYGKALNIDEIKIGKNYISSIVKELKNNKDKRLKSIVSIPIGVEFTVLKKDKKWIYVSVLLNKKLETGFIQANELYSLN